MQLNLKVYIYAYTIRSGEWRKWHCRYIWEEWTTFSKVKLYAMQQKKKGIETRNVINHEYI